MEDMGMQLIILTLLLLLPLAMAVSSAFKEPPVKLSEQDIAGIVAKAPALPIKLDLGTKLTLVDFIDCTNPADQHEFKDQGTSTITQGRAGTYRVTAAHRHAFFAYRFRAYRKDAPHLIVFEYPDDAQRMICFFMHESQITGAVNHMWSLETGVYSGNPYPLTNTMQYHTFYFWPTDSWPVVMVSNWNRFGAPAAASRIWIFAPEKLPVPEMKVPDPSNQRVIGGFHNWSLVPVHGSFGLTDRATAFEHIVDYYLHRGENLVSWPVLPSGKNLAKCEVPAWGVKTHREVAGHILAETDELEGMLAACDKKGVNFVPTFEYHSRYGLGDMRFDPADIEKKKAFKTMFEQGWRQFVDRYGKYKSLYGIAFGTPDLSSPYGRSGLDLMEQVYDGDLNKFTAFIRTLNPDLKIYTFVGARSIHSQYFNDGWDIVSRWEQGGTTWPVYLAQETEKLWKEWNRDPEKLRQIKGLQVIHQYQPDDYMIYPVYHQNPRSAAYFDLDNSQPKSDRFNTGAVMLFNTFFEGFPGLWPGNFWYRKLWVAPDFNHTPPYALAPYARALGHRDRQFILAGAWNTKPAGQEPALRRWSAAFRSLPPVDMADVDTDRSSPVVVRQAEYKDKQYVSVLNTSPFPANITVEFKGTDKPERVSLEPFGLNVVTRKKGQGVERVVPEISEPYVVWVKDRIDEFNRLITEVGKLNPQAVGPAFKMTGQTVNDLFENKQVRQADLELGIGLTNELKLRREIMTPQALPVPKFDQIPEFKGDLAAWPEKACTVKLDQGSDIASHIYMPSSWTGPGDFSGMLKLGHDGTRFYMGIAVTDDIVTEKDFMIFHASKTNYRDWRSDSILCDFEWRVDTLAADSTGEKEGGFKYRVTRTQKGYTVEASVPLASLEVKPGEKFGFYFQMEDDDNTPNLSKNEWARKTVMLYPNRPTFAYWQDARTCVEVALGE